MTYYAVIDTNVIISSMLRAGSIPDEVVQLALEGPIIPLVSEEILAEYEEVLIRNKFGFTEAKIKKMISEIKKRAVFLDRTPTDDLFPDPDDAVFYEIVMTARKAMEAYLVTGNIKHYPVKSFVVTPREMLDIVRPNFDSNR